MKKFHLFADIEFEADDEREACHMLANYFEVRAIAQNAVQDLSEPDYKGELDLHEEKECGVPRTAGCQQLKRISNDD